MPLANTGREIFQATEHCVIDAPEFVGLITFAELDRMKLINFLIRQTDMRRRLLRSLSLAKWGGISAPKI
jgi:hypothetical protein